MNKTKKHIDSKNEKIGVLTKDEIESLKIIQLEKGQKKDTDCYSNASYDLRLGDEYYLPHDDNLTESAKPILNCPYKKDVNNKEIKNCKDNNNILRIKPFTSIVFSTYEKLKMPKNVAGRFDLRIQWAMQGLVLQVGTQIEPGYEGKLFGLLHNFSRKEICIPTKERLLTVEFSFTTKEIEPIVKNNKKDEPLLSLKNFLIKFPVIDGTLENYLDEIKNISKNVNNISSEIKQDLKKTTDDIDDKIKTLENETKKVLSNRIMWVIGISITIISLTLSIGLPLLVTKLSVDKGDFPFQKVYEMETKNKTMYNTMDSVIQVNKESMQLLLQSNQLKIDSINFLNDRIKKLERKLKEKTFKSSKK